MSETSYNNWIHAQLDPDGILIVGKLPKSENRMQAKNREIEKLQKELGLEEYKRRCQEDQNKSREWYEHENNL